MEMKMIRTSAVTALSSLLLATSLEAQTMTTPQAVATDVETVVGRVPLKQPAPAADSSIRPFRAHVSDEAITDLRRRLQMTRWPDKETVTDASQGAQLAKLQELVRYWGTDYDWRKAEAKLNSFP